MNETMHPPVNMPAPKPKWEELTAADALHPAQLDNMKAQMDLVLLALESLAGIGSEAIIRAAFELKLEPAIADRVSLWRLRQSNPLRKGEGGRKKLDVEEARSLVAIACYLAKENQELIRRAVALWEQMAEQNRQPHEAALLGDYLDDFCNLYQDRMVDGENISPATLNQIALKLLIDLLFYSSPGGSRRFWLALFDRSH